MSCSTTSKYLTDVYYDIFWRSSQFMAIYDSTCATFVKFNESMKERVGSASIDNLVVITTSEDEVFANLSGIPCRMRKMKEVEEGIFVVEVFPAHTKTWNQTSDLVRLTDLTSDGVWEWFPCMNFEFMSQRFWDILGYDQSDMEESPMSWMSLINPGDKEVVVKMFQRHVESRGKEPYHATVRYVHKEGRLGIPEEFQQKAFQEFVQGDMTMQGAGIGLTLARRLSIMMGGDVEIEKSSESGTTMLFTSTLKELPHEKATQSLRILIVDDMVTNRQILSRRLESLKNMGVNYTDIVEAVDGLDALSKFTEYNGDFQLVLMDCLMPVIDGFAATLKIHGECERLGLEPVPVVAVTASVSPDVREKCLKHSMKFVVTKPYTEHDLLCSIQACMKITR
ncbi:unnamed protein product [Sphacelaria rigidula]